MRGGLIIPLIGISSALPHAATASGDGADRRAALAADQRPALATRGQSAPARPGDAPARRPALAAVARLAPLAAEPARRGGPVAVIDRGSPRAFLGVPFCAPGPCPHLLAGRIWPRGAALAGPRHGGWPGGDVRRGLDSVRDCNVTAGAGGARGRNRGNTSADVGRPSRFGLGRILPPPGRRVGGGHGEARRPPPRGPLWSLCGASRVGPADRAGGYCGCRTTCHVAPGAASTLMLDRPRQGHLEGLGMSRPTGG